MSSQRRTKIIATIGPATWSAERLEQMILAGMNIARINMSHATHQQAREITLKIRELSQTLSRQVGVLMDLQGPAIRTGDLPAPLKLVPGQRLVLCVRGEVCTEHPSVAVNYDHLVDDLSLGETVLVDNGAIHLRVIEKRARQIHCEVITEGILGNRRHINLPGVRVNLPALTEKDMGDLEVGIESGVDFFAMSFVREASDVLKLRGILEFRRAPQRIIAKLEDQQGIANVEDIIRGADGIMVARGDLGIEMPYEELPIVQRRLVKQCLLLGKPVIVATHMLESMISNPVPTRAEITDVANAVYEQADAIMLSGETSVGQYPLACLAVMDRVARRTERSGGAGLAEGAILEHERTKLMRAACGLAEDLGAAALLVFTRHGKNAGQVARFRTTRSPIYAFTDNSRLVSQLTLHRGVTPFLLPFHDDDPASTVASALALLHGQGLLKRGDMVVIVTEIKSQGELIKTVQMKRLE